MVIEKYYNNSKMSELKDVNDQNRDNISTIDEVFEEENAEQTKKHQKKDTVWVTRSIAEEIGREEVLKKTLIEFVIYVLFAAFASIYIISVNTSDYYLTRGLKRQFLEQEFTSYNEVTKSFDQIKTAADFWSYAEIHMIDSIFWESTYAIPSEKNENQMNILQENKVLGVPRMRQVKVRNNSCIIHDYFRKFFLSCYGQYSESSEDKEEFGLRNGTAWKYNSAETTKSLYYWGKLSTYSGGGFYLDFKHDKVQTLTAVQTLKDNLWVTRGTRAIFVDFSVYNGNINVFGTIKLVFEYPTAGGVIPSADIQAVKLLRFHSTWDWVGFVCEMCCYAFLLYYIMEEVRELMYFGLRYFGRFWNYIDITIIGLLVAGLIITLFLTLEVPSAIKTINKNPDTYGNLEYVTRLYIQRNDLIAVALYLIYLKAFKFLNFNRTMGQLNNTLSKCALDILGFSIMFFIVFFAYSELGYLLFGNQVEKFSTFGMSMLTLLRAVLGDFNYEEISEANRILAPFYFISYIFLVFFVLMNMFLAIINDTYGDVKTEIAIAPNEMQMTEYLSKKFGKLLRKIGLSRFVPEESDQQTDINATIREIREVLKKCGFNDLEIEMFFTRYNIDPWSELHIKDSDKLLEELNLILSKFLMLPVQTVVGEWVDIVGCEKYFQC